MDDSEIEALLRNYRPAQPPPELQARIDGSIRELTDLPARQLTWPWAVAAAALLALAIGLHVTAPGQADGAAGSADHEQRVETLVTALGGSRADRWIAESFVRDEDRAAAEVERHHRLELTLK